MVGSLLFAHEPMHFVVWIFGTGSHRDSFLRQMWRIPGSISAFAWLFGRVDSRFAHGTRPMFFAQWFGTWIILYNSHSSRNINNWSFIFDPTRIP